MRRTTASCLAALTLIAAGCGGDELDPEVGSVELDVNRSSQRARPSATTPEAAGKALADEGAEFVAKEGGRWRGGATECQPSGPVISCVLVVSGKRKNEIRCTARAAIRLLDNGGATVKRVPYTCKTL